MKTNAFSIKNLTFAVLAAGTLVACNQNKPATTTAAPAAAATPGKAEIVFVNEDSISTKYNYAVDMRKRLDDKGKGLQSELQSKQQAFQREYADAQKNAAAMTQDQQKSAGERLQRDNATLQQFQQNAQAEFQTANGDESKKLYEKVVAFTKQYAKDNGYKMVLTFQTGNTTVLYGDPSLDVTADFLKKLNDAYAKEAKK